MASTTILLLTLALESLCLWLAVRGRRALAPLAYFILYQLAFDLAYIVVKPLSSDVQCSVFYWAGHAPMYLLQMWACRPEKWKGIFGVFWMMSAALMLASIVWVWLPHHHDKQIALAMSCGCIMLFVVIAGALSAPGLLRWPIWAGVALWSAAWASGSMASADGGIVYRGVCVAALCFFCLGAWRVETCSVCVAEAQAVENRHIDAGHKSVHAWM
jgi:hypothetical protein